MTAPASYTEFAECQLPADLAMVERCLGWMRDYCQARGLRPVAWQSIELAAAEALANAIKHGCRNHAEGRVRVRWSWQGTEFLLEIIDPSRFLPPPGFADLPEDPLAESGRGGFLMAQSMDRVEHELLADGHCIRLVKEVGAASWNPGEVAQMEATIESMAEDLSRSYEELSALFRFAEQMATSAGFADFLNHSLERLLNLVRGQHAYVRVHQPEMQALGIVRAQALRDFAVPEHLAVDSGAVESLVFLKHEARTIEECHQLPETDPLHYWHGGAYVCPVFFQTAVMGCLVVTLRPRVPYFSAGELSLIRCVADFLGIVQTTSRLQERREAEQRVLRELEIASSIQNSLLPERFPVHSNYRMHGVCVSAQQVGGDYFDALELTNGGILLVIADVMGKGVPAALLATILRTAIHARLHLAAEPGRLLTEVNRQIAGDLERVEMFITAQIAWLPPGVPRIVLANAGHCPMLICQPDGSAPVQSTGGGIPIGILRQFEFGAEALPLPRGARAVFLTDGLYEVENASGEMLGIDRLAARAAQLGGCDNPRFCEAMLEFVRDYSGGRPAGDDRTLLAVQALL